MRLTCVTLAGCLMLAGPTGARAEQKKDDTAAKVVGNWELSKGETLPEGTTLTITKDGKLKLVLKQGEKEVPLDGTYKLDGKKMTITLKTPDGEHTETLEITKLTDTEIALLDENKKTDTFKKK